jgi:sugar lactone lactonase YvrE
MKKTYYFILFTLNLLVTVSFITIVNDKLLTIYAQQLNVNGTETTSNTTATSATLPSPQNNKTITTGEKSSSSFNNQATEISNNDQNKITTNGSYYHYKPSLLLNGTNFFDVSHNDTISLQIFTIAAWIQTRDQSNNLTQSESAHLVDKGGSGTDEIGENMNYGIWFTVDGTISGGFENRDGKDLEVTSPAKYNDGNWHYVLLSYDGSLLRLDIDGKLVSAKNTVAKPDNTGTQPLRIGANSLEEGNFFTGNIDEVRVWNRVLTDEEISNIYAKNTFDSNGLVVYLNFGGDGVPTRNNISSPSSAITNPTKSIENLTSTITNSGPVTSEINETTSSPKSSPPLPPSDKTNATAATTTTATNELNYCYSSQWGTMGKGDGQFLRPHDIVFDSKGFLYVNDREKNDFQKFSLDGKFISKFGEKGSKLGEYLSPYSMAIDSNDNIYVLDRGNDRIVKVNTEGKVLGALYSYDGQWITSNDQIKDADKKSKNTNGVSTQFASIEAMAIDKDGNYYLTDTGHNRIIKFDKNFKYISHFGEFGSGPGQFNHPHGIGIDSDGNIYVNGLNTPKIQKFTNDGKFIKEWGSEGTGPGQFTLELEHLKVDPADRIFITDGAGNPRVQVFDKDGKFLTEFGKLGVGNGEFKKPEHVAFNEKDEKGTVYVVDRGNARIQTFIPC